MSKRKMTESEKRAKSEIEYLEFVEMCFDEGWSPTKCMEGCVVELDGVCPHDFRSYFLEIGLV